MRTEEAIEKFLANCKARGLRPKTLEWYQTRLGRFARACPEIPTELEPIECFLGDSGGSQETKHGNYRALKAFFRFISQRLDISNAVEKVAPPRRPKKVMPTLEPMELFMLLNMAISPRDRALLTLLIDSGARAAEIAGLRWQDIRTETIRVNGKSGEREIPISDETRRQLLGLPRKGEHVFMGVHGPLTRSGIYRVVRQCMTRAGISGPKLGPHRLRHSFGKGYLVAGGDLRSLQEIMGHADIKTTEKYASLNMKDIITKHNLFTPLNLVKHAGQGNLFTLDATIVIREAEQIVVSSERGERR